MSEEVLTESEACLRYHLSRTTLWDARENKKTLKCFKVGRKVLYANSHLREFLATCEQGGNESQHKEGKAA